MIRHVFLAGPALAERIDELTALVLSMHESDKGRGILGARRWQPVQHEDIEFMIDIISTLNQ